MSAPFGRRTSGDEQRSVALDVALGQHVEQRVGQVGEFLGAPRPRSGRTAATARRSAPRRRRGRAPAAAGPRSPNRSSSCRRPRAPSARAPARWPGRPRPPRRRGAVWRRRRPSRGPATPGGPAAAGPCPGPARRCAPREPVCAHRFRGRRPRRVSVPECTAAADRRGDQAAGADAAAQEGPQRRQVDDQAAGDGLLDAAGVDVAAGRQPGVGQRQQRGELRLDIRTGSSAAPSAVRWPAAPPTPRRRCAR